MIITSRKVAFSTPWFDLVAKSTGNAADDRPYYSLQTSDYVSVIAVTQSGDAVLVCQFRPAVEKMTLELPSGHVDPGENPETAAARELFEETGYRAMALEPLGCQCPDTGRLANRIWYFLAMDAAMDADWNGPEPGIEPVLQPVQKLMEDIRNVHFDHSLHVAPILMALLKSDRFRRLVSLETCR